MRFRNDATNIRATSHHMEDIVNTPTLGSILLGSQDPQRLLDWYCAPDDVGFLPFGATDVLIDGRADVDPVNREPGRMILNFHVDDARRTAAHLDELGVSWLVAVEERSGGLFGTLRDPDGNYIQIIQLSPEYVASRKVKESGAFQHNRPFSGFAVDDVTKAGRFYRETLGIDVSEEHGMLRLHIGEGTSILVYPKADHNPTSFTILNIPVEDIDAAVDALARRGVTFKRYKGVDPDERGIFRGGGPSIAWFKDPAGNVLSVLQERISDS